MDLKISCSHSQKWVWYVRDAGKDFSEEKFEKQGTREQL